MNVLGYAAILIVLLALFPSTMAQCYVNNEEVPCGAFFDQFGWIFGLMGIVGILAIAFWLWMLYDCYKRPTLDHKVAWLLVLFFFNIAGALAYLLLIKKNLIKKIPR
jgi:hypothetical protein